MNVYKALPIILSAPLLMVGCAKFNLDKVTYTVTPNPLEYRNDSVAVTIKADYPKKSIPKKGHAVLTPSLEFNGQSVAYPTLKVKGEKSKGEGQVLNHKSGGTVSYTGTIQYRDGMQRSELFVKANGFTMSSKGEKEKFSGKTPNAVAQGVIVTPLLAYVDAKSMAVGKHNYGPIFKTGTSVLYFAYNSKEVRVTDKNGNKQSVSEFNQFVDKQTKDQSSFKGMDVLGYASPEGKEDLNAKLSAGRSENFSKLLQKEVKKVNKELASSAAMKTEAKGADFAGFEKKLSEKAGGSGSKVSSIVRGGVTNAELQKQLKAMDASLAKQIENEVLSPLRRAEVITTVELKPKTEAELKSLSVSDPASLTYEELLYTSQTFISDNNTRLAINQSATKVNPNDWRAYNNAGAAAASLGKWDVAENELRAAEKVAPNEKMVLSNLGRVFWNKGDRKKAEEYFDKASGFPEADQAKGTILILRGKYTEAVSKFGSANTFNSALAKLLAGRAGDVESTLNGGADKDKALSDYLKAIAAARQGNKDKVLSNLKAAFGKDASLRNKSKDDAEFIKYREDADFKGL